MLKAAVEGKLTEDWRAQHPDTEPASVLLERILTERRRQWEKDQLAKFAQAGKQPPKGWQTKYPGTDPRAASENAGTLPTGVGQCRSAVAARLRDGTISQEPRGLDGCPSCYWRITFVTERLISREHEIHPTRGSSTELHERLSAGRVMCSSQRANQRDDSELCGKSGPYRAPVGACYH